jgi:hypothetical protein
MTRLRLIAWGAAVLLAGCGPVGVFPSQTGHDWKDVDSAGVPLGKGAAECKYQAKMSSAASTGIAQQADVAGDLYEQCMQRRGYLAP